MRQRHSRFGARRRALLLVAGLLAATPAVASCASSVDSVNPANYINKPGDGWYRIQTPGPASSPPIIAVYPQSCKSPPSRMGGPEGC